LASGDIGSGLTTGATEADKVANSGTFACAACVTVKVCPAMVSVPVRELPVFAWTEYPTVPLPLPFPPEVIVIQPGLPLTAQGHVVGAVTVTLPAPPAAGADAAAGAIE